MLKSLFFVLLLTACTFSGGYVQGWPIIEDIRVWRVDPHEIYKYCGNGSLWVLPLACAYPDLSKMRCDVYVPEDAPLWVIEHELEHCNGRDYNGILQKQYDNWKLNK